MRSTETYEEGTIMKRVKTYYSLLSLVTCIAPALVIVPAGSATSGTLVIKRTLS